MDTIVLTGEGRPDWIVYGQWALFGVAALLIVGLIVSSRAKAKREGMPFSKAVRRHMLWFFAAILAFMGAALLAGEQGSACPEGDFVVNKRDDISRDPFNEIECRKRRDPGPPGKN